MLYLTISTAYLHIDEQICEIQRLLWYEGRLGLTLLLPHYELRGCASGQTQETQICVALFVGF